jgi:5-methyltetrahydropteroyltriglutamate--homocysteine methyltransferase
MLRSENRILTTHTGSLPRTPALVEMLAAKAAHQPYDASALEREIETSTSRVISRQLEAGIDVGNDGEQARESFFTYVQHRMSGFGGTSNRPIMKDIICYESFRKMRFGNLASRPIVNLLAAPKAIGEVRYTSRTELEKECADFQRIASAQPRGFAETFMTAPSPGIIACAMLNEHYRSDRDYIFALAKALKNEYEHIVASGFVLQIDCPDLAMERHTSFAERPLGEFLAFIDTTIEAINRALTNVPRDRVRMHVCWGNYEGPHEFDVPLEDILPRLYQARVGALVIEMANPRHAHEHQCFVRHPLPGEMLLVAGVIDTKTNYVEHPEVVAERIECVADAIGDARRVLAGTDCGFDTAAGLGEVAEEVVWRKLATMRAGADIATQRLFKH